ncbi:glycosyltransferase family 2 protein [Okeania sp. SIO2B3]|uniref:glycosyltransferase family 2 protein n=1 Tax=Okeania sp. SIO2B3 TaxID=2607784 RepID=UPI0013BF5F6B|nr:glycosyltransferase family 2 protein [Okeania sp. SIO2B3]NET43252.1 glycosyltransferase family 2 protein [Okeania sp. SIO2B3]
MNINEKDKQLIEKPSQDNPEVTVAVVSYNGMKVVKLCLDSILSQTYQPSQILFINNASTDGCPEWVKENYPQVKIIDSPENKGPNIARNLGIKNTPDDNLTLLVDDDAVLEENCLSELVKAYQTDPDGAVWVPKLVYYDKQDTIQYEGTFLHYMAEAILLNPDKPLNAGVKEITQIHATSGTCMLISKLPAQAIGLFDEDYFFGKTDGEFTFRLTLSGYKLYTVPGATCYHRVKKRGTSKVFYQVRNRWYFIITLYSLRTLILSIPAFVVYEFFLISFLLLKGAIKDYVSAILAVFSVWSDLMQKRQSIQSLRKVSDKEVLFADPMFLGRDLLDNPVLKFLKSLLDTFFSLYWKLIYPVI